MKVDEQDRQLIEKVKEGDQFAFRQLVEKYKDESLSLAISIIKDPELAEDILQEVFIKVYDKIGSFKYQSTFYTWLYRIVVNRCYNELRKRKIRNYFLPEKPSKVDSAEHLANVNDLKAVVSRTLKKLKSDEALVLKLFYLSELKIEEVVAITNFSKSKVKVTLHRGRKNFAKMLKKTVGKEIEELL